MTANFKLPKISTTNLKNACIFNNQFSDVNQLQHTTVRLIPEKFIFPQIFSFAFHWTSYILVHKDYSLLSKHTLCCPPSRPFHLAGLFARNPLSLHFFKAYFKYFLFPESSQHLTRAVGIAKFSYKQPKSQYFRLLSP